MQSSFAVVMMHVASRLINLTVQDYDEALKLSPDHILSKMRKGMVLQLLKKPEVIRRSSCIVVGVMALKTHSDANAGAVFVQADIIDLKVIATACKGLFMTFQRPQNMPAKHYPWNALAGGKSMLERN